MNIILSAEKYVVERFRKEEVRDGWLHWSKQVCTVLGGVDEHSDIWKRYSNIVTLIMTGLGEMHVHKQYSMVMLIITDSMGEHYLVQSSLTKSDSE